MMEVADEDRGYVCSLSEESLKKAAEELNEDPRQRLSQVDTLRRWIKQQPHLSSHTDTEFLLQFLRAAKFSQLRAREKLEGIIELKTSRPEWFYDVDVMQPDILQLLKTGVALPLPKKDRQGRQIMLQRLSQVDPGISPQLRIQMSEVVMSHVLRDENTQVNGLVTIIDFTGMTAKHLTSTNFSEMKKFSQAMQKNMPARMKAFHYYNLGVFFEALMALVKQVLNDKFMKRLHVHTNLESLYKEVPMECFPDEYLPDDYTGPSAGSLDSILENFLKKIQTPEFCEYVKKRTSRDMALDEKKRVGQSEPAASFRKLNLE